MKRLLTLLLSLMIFLAAWPAFASAEDVYAEVLLSLPDGYSSPSAMCQIPGGGYAVAAKDESGNWALITWASLDAESDIMPLEHSGNNIDRLSIAPDGSILAALSIAPPMDGGNNAVKGGGDALQGGAETDGAPAEGSAPAGAEPNQRGMVRIGSGDMNTELVWFDAAGAKSASFKAGGYAQDARALNLGRAAVLLAMDGAIVYDDQGGELVRVGADAQAIASDGEALYALESSGLNRYDAATGAKTGSMELAVEGSGTLLADSEDGLWLIDTTGIYGLDFEAGAKTEITGSMGQLFGDPDSGAKALARLNDGSFVVLLGAGAGNMGRGRTSIMIGGEDDTTLVAYRLRDDIDASQRQDFTITALRSSATLQKAASEFQRLHPELNVKLQTQMTADDESPVDDHIRTLNTDLLAGKGGDVLVLDELPLDKYIKRGILADLSGDLKDVELLAGVRAAAEREDGSLYAVPTRFSFDMLWGNQSAIDALTSLEDLPYVDLPSGQTPMTARTYEDWLALFYPANEALFRDEQNQLDLSGEAFTRFLDALYALYSQQGDLPDEGLTGGGRSPQATLDMLNGATAYLQSRIVSLTDLMIGYTISGAEESACSTIPTLEGPSNSFIPAQILGVGAQSNQKELAVEFIRLMLSPEMQELDMNEGLPTLKPALDKQFEQAVERAQAGDNIMAMISFPGSNPIEMEQPDEETLQNVRALIDSLDNQAVLDDTLMGFIEEECDAFFAGRQDARSAAEAITQRAWSYLNE